MDLTNINTIKALMQKHNMKFSKSLGQNFLINPEVCPQIAELGGVNPEVGVLEIGPGVGVLTKELAQRAKKVVAIELDKKLLPILKETLASFDNVEIVQGDVMEIDLDELIRAKFPEMEIVVCANLPYYITSPIIMKFLESRLAIKSITAMVQKEAAERLCAKIPSREMGAITVTVSYFAEPHILFDVSRDSFMPSPNVESSVIKLDVLESPNVRVSNENDFFKVVKAAFSQRRKTISNSLSSGLSMEKSDVIELLESCEIPANMRAEQLSMEDFAKISNYYTANHTLKDME